MSVHDAEPSQWEIPRPGAPADARPFAGFGELFADVCLAAAAVERPAVTALTDDRTSLSFRQAEDAVTAVAVGLWTLGIHQGDVVSWQLPAWHEAHLLHLAVIRIGAISNPIDLRCRGAELEDALVRARSRLVVVPEEFDGFRHSDEVTRSRAVLPELRHVVVARPGRDRVARSFDSLRRHAGVRHETVPRTPDDPALLVFTAGTGGRSKAVVHTHRSLASAGRGVIDRFRLTAGRPVFAGASSGDATGFVYGVQVPAMLSASVVLGQTRRPRASRRLIARHRCGLVVAEPGLVRAFAEPPTVDADFSALHALVCVTGTVTAAELRAAAQNLARPVARAFGLAEYPALAIGAPGQGHGHTTYHLLPGATAVLVDHPAVAASRAAGTGELSVSGPALFAGYLAGPDSARPATSDGWFRTGDVVVDHGRDGFAVHGKAADRVRRGDEELEVTALEDVAREHRGIRDVALVGMPCPALRQRVCAFVVPAPGCRPTLPELADFLLRQGVARRMLPERLEVVARLPRTPAGEIRRFRLRELITTRLIEEFFASL
ncbi:AMP-binding protein [Amycolatopsis sp. NPDC049253]|uniref:AMP-binding protein n=1 Tax=Amycolatopsis sp. NPDC049253 TaxID=3155274 RepID=UPI0034137869